MSKKKRKANKAHGAMEGGNPRPPAWAGSAEARDQRLMDAVLAYRATRYAEAEGLCRQMLAAEPGFAPATQVLGLIAARTGRTALAIQLLGEVVALDRHSDTLRTELAFLLQQEGRHAEAIVLYRQALQLKSDNPYAHNKLGLAYLAEGRLPEAIASFESGISLQLDIPGLHHNLGVALQLQSRDDEAADCYRRAIVLAPNQTESYAKLGQILLMQGELEEAAANFSRAIEVEPSSLEERIQLARLLSEIGQPAFAENCLRHVIAVDGAAYSAYEELGNILQQLGRFDEAIAHFERVIALRPERAAPYLGLISCKKIGDKDRPLLERAASLLDADVLSDRERAQIHYSLGKAGDDLAEYEDAMRHFDEANRIAAHHLRNSGRAIDRKRHADNIDRLIASFTPEFFRRYAALGSHSELPILIVGMIRSGTTLVEQIVSSHPEVGAGGELRFWGDRSALIGDAALGDIDASAAGLVAEDYCRLLRGIAPGSRRVTDKMPTNFLLLGLIHLIFPRARIIHCHRNPLDNCLSIYFTPYLRSPDYAHDRDNIVFYYQQYARLMAHWRRVLPPDRFHEVKYEELVGDRTETARRMIAFSGLDWHDACLRHESNERAIKTPSQWQARQPLYRSSVQRWRHYDRWLREFSRLAQA